MRETYQPPTTSPTGPPHDHTHPRHSHSQPHHFHSQPRHSREGGNLHTETAPSRRPQNSTQSNRIRQNPTETRVRAFLNVPAHAREATAFRFLSLGMDRIRRIAWSCRLISLMPTNQTEPGLANPIAPSARPALASPRIGRTARSRRPQVVEGCLSCGGVLYRHRETEHGVRLSPHRNAPPIC